MRRIIPALMAIMLILFISGCEEGLESVPDSVSELLNLPAEETPSSLGGFSGSNEPETPSSAALVSDEDVQAAQAYRAFLSESYDKLAASSFKSIAGIGFIDLDLDGCRELIIFDAGASASMGVQIFDIIDGEIQCVTANIQAIGDAFGGKNFSSIVINANFMEDFRLMEDVATGERFFVVESTNGNVDSSYSELIRFGNDGGVLTLSSVFYKYEELDAETGEVLLQRFRVGSADAKLSGYTAVVREFYAGNEDAGLECHGVFVWEDNEYAENYKNFMNIVDKALGLYEKNWAS